MNYEMDEEDLLKKIDCSELDDGLKSIFRKTIHELCAYNRIRIESLERNILFPTPRQAIGEIVIALAPRPEKPDKPYFGLTEIDGASDDLYFLNAPYEKLRELVGDLDTEKVYTGICRMKERETPFRYRLRFDGRYLKAQDLIFRLASMYQTENAVLWSPFLRKAVRVQLLDPLPEGVKKEAVCYRFEQNGLPVMEGVSLLWNLRVTSTDFEKASGKIPYGQDVKYKFHFEKSRRGGWRFPIPQNNQTIVYDIAFSDEGIDLLLDHELEAFRVVESMPVDQEAGELLLLRKGDWLHSNRTGRSILSVHRILSKGDMEFAIRPFRDANGVRCELTDELTRVCTRYSAKYQSHLKNRILYPQPQHKKARGKLKFSAELPPAFYDDYINFVLLYLAYYYPEIEWVGGW